MTRRYTTLLGNRQRLDGGAMFGNAPRALWERWTPPDERHRIVLNTRALLIEEPDGRQILLEAGVGAFFDPKLRDRYGVEEAEHRLLDNLRAAGRTEADIDLVILSHLHFDHAGGLLSAWREGEAPRLHFPKARYLVSESAWKRACSPHIRDRASFLPALNALLEASGRLMLVGPDDAARHLGPDWKFILSDGHTPGMLLTQAGPVVFAADLIPGLPWLNTAITMGYDRFPERVIDEKASLLQRAATEDLWLAFTHDPEVALCRVRLDDAGRATPLHPLGEVSQWTP